jgi:hypothetical protein
MRLLALQQSFGTWLTSESAEVAAHFGERTRPGLAVYLNNYRAQLLSCLSASFPVLRTSIGGTAFEAAAARHIDRVPPHAWTLDAYGFDFADTLTGLYPGNPEVAELASLERALEAAFVGPDAAAVEPAALAGIDWQAAIVQFVPTFRRLRFATNVAAIWSAIDNHETPPPAACLTEPANVAIWRDDFAPRFRMLGAEEATIIDQVLEGKTFGAICADAVERLGQERGAQTVGLLLGQWLKDHMVGRICT